MPRPWITSQSAASRHCRPATPITEIRLLEWHIQESELWFGPAGWHAGGREREQGEDEDGGRRSRGKRDGVRWAGAA
jgi:hypothetical protein